MYTYGRLAEDIAYLGYNGIDVGTAGRSTLGLKIPYVHIGEYCGPQLIVTGAIHARENITALLVMRQAYHTAFGTVAPEGGIYFLPMLNPDGAMLIEKGAGFLEPCRRDFLLKLNGGSNDFSLWKANIRGVDLNNNFDARFALGAGQKNAPAPQGYRGKYPFSETEACVIRDFTLSVRPAMTVSYHALGQEIYWNFFQTGRRLERDRQIATAAADLLGYKLIDSDLGSTGGYKDWCVQALGIPALTIEIVSDKYSHPVPLSALGEEWERNKDLPVFLSSLIRTPFCP